MANSESRLLWEKVKWPLLALGLVLLFNLAFTAGFFHLEIKNGRLYGSLIDILHRGAPVMLLTLGMTLVIATGGVDLSVGAIMAICGAFAATLVAKQTGFAPTLLLTLGLASFCGLWNGLLVAFLEVQPIIATLILMVAGRGIAQLVTGGQIVTFENPSFVFVSQGQFLGLPFTVTIVAAVFACISLLTRKTAIGLFLQAVGDNETASRLAGVRSKMVILFSYVFCGFCSGVAGLIAASDIKAADANNAGLYLELDAILAVVIGGTALTGGRFFLFSSLVGAVLIQSLTTTILTRGIPVEFTLVVKASFIICVCLLQSDRFRQTFARRKTGATA